MVDASGNTIYVGDLLNVSAEEELIDGYLTYAKFYEVTGLQEESGRVIITDDTGREGWYRATRFNARQHFSELP